MSPAKGAQQTQAGPGIAVAKLLVPFVAPGPHLLDPAEHPRLQVVLCPMQDPGEIQLCFLCGGLFHVIPLGETFGGKGRVAGPSSQADPK